MRHEMTAACLGAAAGPAGAEDRLGGPVVRSACRNAAVGTGGTSSHEATLEGVTPRRSQKAR